MKIERTMLVDEVKLSRSMGTAQVTAGSWNNVTGFTRVEIQMDGWNPAELLGKEIKVTVEAVEAAQAEPVPATPPQMSPGTLPFPVVEIGDQSVSWSEFKDEHGLGRTYGGYTVYQDAYGKWINTNNGYRTYLQPSAALDAAP